MSGPATLAIAAGVLVDAGLKATALLGLGAVAARLLQSGSAAQRHAVWAATFAAMPLLPLLAAWRGAPVALDASWLIGVWALGAVLAALPIARGLIGLARLRRSATPDPVQPRLLYSDTLPGPVTWGLLRPVVVLPVSARGWSRAHRDAALAHEYAHIARRDWAVHLAVWGVCALFWFHPLAWLARRALAREAEHAADDAVLAQGVRPSTYASLLVAMAAPRVPQAALGVGSSLVGSRVRAVLDHRSRSARRWLVWLLALGLGAPSSVALGSLAVWSPPPEAPLSCSMGPMP